LQYIAYDIKLNNFLSSVQCFTDAESVFFPVRVSRLFYSKLSQFLAETLTIVAVVYKNIKFSFNCCT